MKKVDEAKKMALDTLCNKLSVTLFYSPLDYIFADHFRQRVLCGVLDDLAGSQIMDKKLLSASVNYLKIDFKYHIADEEEDLFPLLRERAEPDDKLEDVLDQLCEEHSSDCIDAKYIIKILEGISTVKNNEPSSAEFIGNVNRFTTNERHHLIVENAIVMPLARVRLTEPDLISMGLNMAKRRGVELPRNNHVN